MTEAWHGVQSEQWEMAKQRTEAATLVRGAVEAAHKSVQDAEDAYQGAWLTAVETAEAWAASDELIQWHAVEKELRSASASRSIAAAAATTAATVEAEHDATLQAALQATEIAEDQDPSGWHIAQAKVMKGWIEEAARETSAVAAAEYDEAQYDALMQLKATVEAWTGVENLRQAEEDGLSAEELEAKVEEATLTDAVEEAAFEAAEAELASEKTAAAAEELRRAAEATEASSRASGSLGAAFQNAVGRRAKEAVMVAAVAEETAEVTRARYAKGQKIVDDLIQTMDVSSLMYSIRTEGLTVNQVNEVRQKLPEGSRMMCVKNSLVKRAVADIPKFQGGDDILEYSNYWFFAPEDQMRETVDCWIDFMKDL